MLLLLLLLLLLPLLLLLLLLLLLRWYSIYYYCYCYCYYGIQCTITTAVFNALLLLLWYSMYYYHYCYCYDKYGFQGTTCFITPSRSLRSASDTRIFRVPRMGRRALGERSFQYTWPVIWNSLPLSLSGILLQSFL